MKKFLLFIISFTYSVCTGQPVPTEVELREAEKQGYDPNAPSRDIFPVKNGVIFYEVIEEAPGRDKNTLYTALKIWAATSFNNPNYAIRMDDREAGLLIAKSAIKYQPQGFLTAADDAWVRFVLEVTVKDEKYRVRMKDFEVDHYKPSLGWGQLNLTDQHDRDVANMPRLMSGKTLFLIARKIEGTLSSVKSHLSNYSYDDF